MRRKPVEKIFGMGLCLNGAIYTFFSSLLVMYVRKIQVKRFGFQANHRDAGFYNSM